MANSELEALVDEMLGNAELQVNPPEIWERLGNDVAAYDEADLLRLLVKLSVVSERLYLENEKLREQRRRLGKSLERLIQAKLERSRQAKEKARVKARKATRETDEKILEEFWVECAKGNPRRSINKNIAISLEISQQYVGRRLPIAMEELSQKLERQVSESGRSIFSRKRI